MVVGGKLRSHPKILEMLFDTGSSQLFVLQSSHGCLLLVLTLHVDLESHFYEQTSANPSHEVHRVTFPLAFVFVLLFPLPSISNGLKVYGLIQTFLLILKLTL